MAQDLYARRLAATTAFIRATEDLLEPSSREKQAMRMAEKKANMQMDLDFYVKRNDISNKSAIEQLRLQNEMKFEEFKKMEDEKYRRQVEMYKDGELLSAKLAHEATIAAYSNKVLTEQAEAVADAEAIKKVTEGGELQAALLPTVGRGKSFGIERRVGFSALGLSFNANTVLETGNSLLTTLAPTISDLQTAAENGVDVKNNYLYKRALETVRESRAQLGHRRINKRMTTFKSPEQINTWRSQQAQLAEMEKSLLSMVTNTTY